MMGALLGHQRSEKTVVCSYCAHIDAVSKQSIAAAMTKAAAAMMATSGCNSPPRPPERPPRIVGAGFFPWRLLAETMEYLGGDVALATTASLGGDAAPSELHDAGADFPGKSVRALLAWLLRPHFHVNE